MHRITASLIAMLTAGCLAPSPSRFTPLAIAARTGDLVTMKRLLAAGVSPNVFDPGGNRWTPLLHAIHKGQLGSVDVLLRSGAEPRLSVHGMQPLLMAVGTGNAAIVRRLLKAGADPRSDDNILLTAVSGGPLSDLDNPLLGRCNGQVAKALLEYAPDLRLRGGPRTRIALLFAWFNHCGAELKAAGVKGPNEA
jgi:ankyrin repeat protein